METHEEIEAIRSIETALHHREETSSKRRDLQLVAQGNERQLSSKTLWKVISAANVEANVMKVVNANQQSLENDDKRAKRNGRKSELHNNTEYTFFLSDRILLHMTEFAPETTKTCGLPSLQMFRVMESLEENNGDDGDGDGGWGMGDRDGFRFTRDLKRRFRSVMATMDSLSNTKIKLLVWSVGKDQSVMTMKML